MNIKIDPVYYYSRRGIGEVTRQVLKTLNTKVRCSLLSNLISPQVAQTILKVPFLFLIWEQLITPCLLKFNGVNIYLAAVVQHQY